MKQEDKNIFDKLFNETKEQEKQEDESQYGSAFTLHLVFKAVPMGLFLLKNLIATILGRILTIEIILILIVIDFWLTKNVNGRRMIGTRWSFDDDQYGVERFKFETRINEEFVSGTSKRLFWIIQGLYVLIPLLYLVFSILFHPFGRIHLEDVLLCLALLIGGASNFFFFWKARSASEDRRSELKNKVGGDFMKKMGLASVVSYL